MKKRPKARAHETRYFALDDFEVRADGDEPPHIVGMPIRYNVWSDDLGGFRERVLPGSMTKTLGESDIRGLFNHDPNMVIGRNKAQTMTLADEADGVRMDAVPPDATWATDLLASMRRKDIDQGSFGFRSIRDEWREGDERVVKKDDLWERDLLEVQLFDVSVVTFPAFAQTRIDARSLIGEIDGIGIDWTALTACLTRAERGLPITDTDVDLLTGSIQVIRGYLPSESEPDPATTPDEPQAGRSRAHLRRLLDLEELLMDLEDATLTTAA